MDRNSQAESSTGTNKDKKQQYTAYKLLIDPSLVKGGIKLYRFDGVVQDDPTYPSVHVRDPRNTTSLSRIWNKLEVLELPIPRFKIDSHYVGNPPPLEVTITNLNDNIDKAFLCELMLKYGAFEDVIIFYHPETKKHLNLARVIFESVSGAKACVSKLHNTPVMGKVLTVFVDSFGKRCNELYIEMISEKPKIEPKKIEERKTSLLDFDSASLPPPGSLLEKISQLSKTTPKQTPKSEYISPHKFNDDKRHNSTKTGRNLAALCPPVPRLSTPKKSSPLNSFSKRDEEDKVELDESSPKMDLDTRIKLILKSKNSAPFAKFLSSEASESEEELSSNGRKRKMRRSENEDEFMKKFKKSNPSPPPSPFLEDDEPERGKTYKPRTNGTVKHDGHDICSDDEKRLMSGSVENIPPLLNPDESYYPYEYYGSISNGAYDPSAYLYSSSHHTHQNPHIQGENEWYPPPLMSYEEQAQLYAQSLLQYSGVHPPPPVQEEEIIVSPQTELKLFTQRIIKSVSKHLVQELDQIINRDCERRNVEVSAYKDFETWIAESIKAHKEESEKAKAASNSTVQKISTPENGKILPISSEGAFGAFNFRQTLPNLPTFKIKKKTVTPKPEIIEKDEEEELKKDFSDNESDSDALEINKKPPKPLSLTSSSESDLSSSESDEVDEDASSSSSSESFASLLTIDIRKEPSPPLKTSPKSQLESLPPETETRIDEVVVKSEAEEEEEVRYYFDPERSSSDKVEISSSNGYRYPLSHLRPPLLLHLLDHNYAQRVGRVVPVMSESEEEEGRRGGVGVEGGVSGGRRKKGRGVTPEAKYRSRTTEEEREILTSFLRNGVDEEDLEFFKKTFHLLKKDPLQKHIVENLEWVDHPPTKSSPLVPKKNKRVHLTGSARSEGFYKLTKAEKQANKQQWAYVEESRYIEPGKEGAVGATALTNDKLSGKTMTELARSARSNQRRLLTAYAAEVDSKSEILKFNQLKFRNKALRFRRSVIHDWGLFAAEPIAADEMVIEYVGQKVRYIISEIREKKYEASGIGSSYLFRVDSDVIDATKCGNLSRFINHSCDPNCYAKVITIDGKKKIVIYSKQAIAVGEEITYDYKFPIEEQKIQCLCGTSACRGTLN